MSKASDTSTAPIDPRHVHGSDSDHDSAAAHGTLRGYLTGFVLAAILTVIPFWLVMDHVLASTPLAIALVLLLGVAQIFVHVVYFLHMDSTSESGWNLMALVFTLVLVVIVLSGSIWIMYHLNINMMMGPPTAN